MPTKKNDKILVADDEAHIGRLLVRWLSAEGYDCVHVLRAEDALPLLAQQEFSLAVLDIMMPGMSGMELLAKLRDIHPDVAVIMVTAVDDRSTSVRALQLGAYGYVIKPFEANEIIINVVNALERRRLVLESLDYERGLEQKVLERTAEVRATQEELVVRLVEASEFRDEETGAHIKRMGMYAAAIADELGWPADAVGDIRLAAPMHDIGKIGVPDAILLKPGKLTPEEFEEIKKHPLVGAQILRASNAPLLRMAQDIALSHHEKLDGRGYPNGLSGDAIPISARIVAIGDVYDALVHDRVYRPAMSEEQAVGIITEGRGSHFDPDVFDAFIKLLPQFRAIRAKLEPSSP